MNKAELIEKISSRIACTKADAERALDVVIDGIVDAVSNGVKVSIAGLGIFSSKEMKAKVARNPKTGEKVDVPARTKVKFAPSKTFKEAVNK